MVSRKFIEAVKLDERKSYQIAHLAGLHSTILSKLVSGIDEVKKGDQRVLAVGRVLGIPDEDLFDDQPAGQ